VQRIPSASGQWRIRSVSPDGQQTRCRGMADEESNLSILLASLGAGQVSAAGVAVPIGAARESCATYRRTVCAQHVELRRGETTPAGLPATVWIAVPPCPGWLQDRRPQPHAPVDAGSRFKRLEEDLSVSRLRLLLANHYGDRCGGVEPGHVHGEPGECCYQENPLAGF
jgi:hypothetical protein